MINYRDVRALIGRVSYLVTSREVIIVGALNFKMAAPRFVNVFGEVMNALKNLIAKTTKDTGGTIFKSNM